MFMEKIVILFFMAMVSFLGWSCSRILNATFESDALNTVPATDLPGAPAGDVIDFHPAISTRLKVQNSTISGSKALHFIHDPIADPPPLSSQWLNFKGVGTDLTKTLWFVHTGQNNGVNVSIDVSDGHGHLMARMLIQVNGEVALSENLGDNYSNVIGNVGSGKHTVIFTVFASTLKYNVSILKESGPAITAENLPMITTDPLAFNNPAHPMLSFLHNDITNGNNYAIGSVYISRKEP
jgi:hypothetical protein